MGQAADPHKSIPLSVIMPAYNEQDNITAAVCEVQSQVLALVDGAEFIVVNDGSSDRTLQLLEELSQADSRIVVIDKANAGHGPALLDGMKASRGEYFFLIDSDMQIPLDCFGELWRQALQCDGAFGIRKNRQDPGLRLLISSMIKAAAMMMFGVKAADINAPCKLFRRVIWESFRIAVPADDILAPSIMLNIFARSHKYAIKEIPVSHRARVKGTTSLNLRRLIPFCFHGWQQLIEYRTKLI